MCGLSAGAYETVSEQPQGSIYHPGFGETLHYRADVVSDDPDTQVAQTIGMMSRLVREDTGTPEIQADARAIRTGGSGDLVADTFQWVRSRMSFVRDESTAYPLQQYTSNPIVEVLIRPRDMSVARRAQGDCDDFTDYGAALLRANGVKVNLVTVAQYDHTFSHVYVAAYPGGKRLPVDFSHGPQPGWEYENPSRFKEWELDVPTGSGLGGLAVLAALIAAGIYYARKGGR